MAVGRPERKPRRVLVEVVGTPRARCGDPSVVVGPTPSPTHRDAAAEKATRGTKRGVLRARSTAVGAAAQIYFLLT